MSSDERRRALQQRMLNADPIGLLGYPADEAVAWCSVAPRKTYERLERSTTIKRMDDRETWSVVCLFITPGLQRKGLSVELLQAAAQYARERGAAILEGYPVDPEFDHDGARRPAKSYRFMGYRSSFEQAGFLDVTPPGSSRRIMRLDLAGK